MEADMAVDTNGGEGPRRTEATTVFPHITARTISIIRALQAKGSALWPQQLLLYKR